MRAERQLRERTHNRDGAKAKRERCPSPPQAATHLASEARGGYYCWAWICGTRSARAFSVARLQSYLASERFETVAHRWRACRGVVRYLLQTWPGGDGLNGNRENERTIAMARKQRACRARPVFNVLWVLAGIDAVNLSRATSFVSVLFSAIFKCHVLIPAQNEII